ncbi:MAG: sigma-70 family RNA polymerase sigma factor [Clostridiales bacterium]|nr:sigma-70 family RNA polymerase sigma factor [Clostridiales bacterium]
MIIDLITKVQEGNEDAALLLVKKFNPLLKKYAFKLYYEDAYNDLLVDFIELIHNVQLDHIRNKSEGSMVSYICTSVRASYIKRLVDIKKLHNFISFSELSDSELYYADVLSSAYDEYFKQELPDIHIVLTAAELSVIKMIYYFGYTATEIASTNGTSRQAVNQMKKRALKKLKHLFSDKPERRAKI